MKVENFILKALAKIRRVFRYNIVKRKLNNKKYTHLYIGSPLYSNLGDQQIRKSSIEFLKKNKIKFVELSKKDYYFYKNLNFDNIKTIILPGGGNLGDVYDYDQSIKNDVIERFTDKKIIVFPQTFHCDDYSGEKAQNIKKIFSNHKNLILFAREKKSFDMMQQFFENNKIFLCPDIVLSSDYSKKKYKRKNVLFLMRRDIEKVVDDSILTEIKENFKNKKIIEKDTFLENKLMNEINREYETKKIFKSIKKAEIVFTDRLHGMVFCAITNTPCVVFSNYNHKVKGTYDWIKHLGYIKYVDKVEDISKIKDSVSMSKTKYEPLTEKYDILKKVLGEN